MSKDQSQTYLKYGQGILIQGFKTHGEGLGFLTAKGFADSQAKYQTFNKILYFKNYRNAIFQIIPAGNFEINDELRKILENSNQQTPNVKILKARAKSELTQFELKIQASQKTLITFGSDVIFKHVDSQTYLSGTIRPSNGKNGAFSVQVTKNLSESLIFTLDPFRSFEKKGEPIRMDSPIRIRNKFNNGCLTFQRIGLRIQGQKSQKIDFDKKPINADDTFRIPVKTNSSDSQIYDTVTHFVDLSQERKQDPMPWQFVLHAAEVQNNYLLQHDIVYFQHTANGGVLSTSGLDIVLKELKGENTSQLKFYECLWEIQRYKEKGQDAYILRHLISGMTLGIEKVKEEGEENQVAKRPILVDISDGDSDGALQKGYVELKLAKKEGGIINSNSFVNIAWGDAFLDIKKSEDGSAANAEEENSDELFPKNKLKQMALAEQEYQIKQLEFTMDISKHCFVIQEIQDDLKKKVLFALSFHSKIIDLRQDLKWGPYEAEKKVEYLRMMQVNEKIKEIKQFLKNCTAEQADLEHIHPLEMQQNICKDLGISELLFELLFYMKENLKQQGDQKPIFQQKHNERQKFIQLYNTIYEVITELIKNNKMFKIHVSKWIMFILTDLIKGIIPPKADKQDKQNSSNNEDRDFIKETEVILNMIKELLTDNQFIVNNFVTDNLIQYLASEMIDAPIHFIFKETKYLEIFRKFCIINGAVNIENQIKILKNFINPLKNKKNGFIYSISLSIKDKVVYTEAAIDKNISKKRRFADYYKICKEQYLTAWLYFIEYLNLIADMTKGRNKIVEQVIKIMIPLDVLTELIDRQNLQEAEVPVIRLLHYLYAETNNFYPIQRKNRIVDYQKLGSQQITVMCAKDKSLDPITNQFIVKDMQLDQNSHRVLKVLLQKIRTFGPIQPKQIAKNQNLFHILDFIWQTLNLGFWTSKQQISNILSDILKILQPYDKINYKEVKVESKQNLLMIDCKLQCMKIIQAILDYDLDLSVRYLCKHFQKFELPKKEKKIGVDVQKMMELKVDNQLAQSFIQSFPASIQPMVSSQIVSQMVELSYYNNPSLTSQSISILERVLLSKIKSLESFYKQIFICGEERRSLASYIQYFRKQKFFSLDDQTLVNVSMRNQDGNYVVVYREDQMPKDSGIMQDMFMISELIRFENTMKNMISTPTLDSSKTFIELGTSKMINFTSERTSSDWMKQSVLDAENLHMKVLQFVLNCKEIPTEQLAKKLLHLCYRFLVGLLWNYQSVKIQFIPHVPRILHHISQNVGCIDFLKEMYDNNKNMLYNETEITILIKEICYVMDKEDENSYYKSKLLDFFRFLIYCNGKSLKFNQMQILKIMQDDSYKNIIINLQISKMRKDIIILVDEYIEMNKVKQTKQGDKLGKYVKMNPKLVYYCTYFQILESLIDDNNKVNMGKLIKKFPFTELINLVRECKNCWPLKRNVRAFLNRLYYFQPKVQQYMQAIIQNQVTNIIQDLNYYIELKTKANAQEYQNQLFQNPIRFTYLQSYLYLNLQQNLFTLYQLITRKETSQQMNNFLHSLTNPKPKEGPYNFIRICERLGWIKNYFADKKNVYSNSFIKFLLSKFKTIISEFDDSVYMEGMKSNSTNKNRGPSKSQKEQARVKIIDKIMQGQIGSFFVSGQYDNTSPLVYLLPQKISGSKDDKPFQKHKLMKKLKQILKRKKRQFKTHDEQISYKMNSIVTAIKLSPQAQALLMKDYNQKVEKFSSDQSIFKYITIIIDMNSINPEALPQNEKKFFLQLITGIVEQNNKKPIEGNKQIDEWNADDWFDYRDKIQSIQIKLKGCGLGKFIIQLLKENIYDNIEFANAILLCGIAYMLGGNTLTQKNIIQQMMRDDLNKVMKNIDILISKLGKFILKNIDDGNIKEDPDNTFSTTTIDNYDFYDVNKKYVLRKNVFEPPTTDQQIYYQKCIITYRRAFKFLQLMCENNNIEGKNWIRHQPDKVRQANFINVATKELRNLFQALNKDIAPVPMFLIDFLLEVTQIPVKLNQQALMSLTFFEDICQMHNFFTQKNKANLAKRGFQNNQGPLNEIYFKAIEIILSNFEGNDVKTFEAISQKLQVYFLTQILKDKLKEMGIKTKEDLENYIEQKVDIVFDDDMTSVLNIIKIFLKIYEKLCTDGQTDNIAIYNNYMKLKLQSPENAKLFDYLESLLINIEIRDEYQVGQVVLFPKHPVFNSLSGDLRDYVMTNVERGSRRDKIVSMLGYVGGVGDKLEKSYTLEKQENISEKNMKRSFQLSAFMSIILCIYMMNFSDIIIEFGEAQFTSGRLIGLSRFFLSLIQLSMTCVYAYYWFKLRIWEKPIRQSRDSSEAKNEFSQEQGQGENPKTRSKLLVYWVKIKEWGPVSVVMKKVDALRKNLGLDGGKGSSNILKSVDFYRLLLYVGVSFLGTFYHPPLFFIHIIDIFCNNGDLANIFAAIGMSLKSIMYVSLLGIVFVFIFCTVTFSNYMKDVYADAEESDMCETIIDCLMQLFVSGAIGETMSQFEIMRFTYDMIYITFFGLLFGNIVSGIMLDAFGSLRTMNDDLASDKKNFCYICNISREQLQKQGKSFVQHTEKKHFLWNYVFYIYSLQKKSPTDYTGLEYYISTRYNRPDEQVDVEWAPTGDAVEFDSAEKLKQLIEKVQGQNAKLGQDISKIEEKINEFNKIAADYMG